MRYYSTERGDWEEIPAELVDVAKTEAQRKTKADENAREAKAIDEEEKAEREQQREISSIPMESGAYFKVADVVKPVHPADYEVITSKKRKARVDRLAAQIFLQAYLDAGCPTEDAAGSLDDAKGHDSP